MALFTTQAALTYVLAIAAYGGGIFRHASDDEGWAFSGHLLNAV